MRILLALITIFAVFQTQAHCYIEGNNTRPDVDAEPITLDLDANNTSKTENINFHSLSAPNFECLEGDKTPNKFTLSVENNTSEYYEIRNGIHKLFLKISLKPFGQTVTENYADGGYFNPEMLDKLQYQLSYSIEKTFSGIATNSVDINNPIKLNSYITIKPDDCSLKGCTLHNNSNHQYIYHVQIKPMFTPTTCFFRDQQITVPAITYNEIDENNFTAPTSSLPKMQCNSTTGLATSNVHYYFEPISDLSGNILKNDLETESGSAGEVGFELMNDENKINFNNSEKFNLISRGSSLNTSNIYDLKLKVRYARYGNKVRPGQIESKVKVVIDYD